MTDKDFDFEFDLDGIDQNDKKQEKSETNTESSKNMIEDESFLSENSKDTEEEISNEINKESTETDELDFLDVNTDIQSADNNLDTTSSLNDAANQINNSGLSPSTPISGITSKYGDLLSQRNMIIGGIVLGVIVIGAGAGFYFLSKPKTPVIVNTPSPVVQESVISDQSSTTEEATSSGASETTNQVSSTTESGSESQSGSADQVTSSDPMVITDTKNDTVTNTGVEQREGIKPESSNNSTSTEVSSTTSSGILSEVKSEPKDPSDISIPLKSVTEKVEVNSDGSLKKTQNTDIDSRNVKDGSIIIDNSQNKLPNILDMSVSGIQDGRNFKVTDEIKISLDGVTNSLSINPTIRGVVNKDAYIITINLSFYKDSIISAEKGTLKYSEVLPLDFMKVGQKKVFIMVNGSMYKKLTFNIQ